jgi:cell division protein FtsB
MNRELFQIFGVTPLKANYFKRKVCISEIERLRLSINRWQSMYARAAAMSGWFINDRINERQAELDKLSKRLTFLKREMAHLKNPEDETKKIKYIEYDKEAINAIPIIEILHDAGIDTFPAGSNRAKCLCMFHNETNPSMNINIDKNYVHCFSCGQSADVIKLYQQLHGVDFINALKELNYKL